VILSPGSWSPQWGVEGFCWLSEAVIEAGSWFECYSVKAVVDDPQAANNPPLAKVLANLPKKTTWTPPDMIT
jgi:hypothetical protein